MRQPLTGRKIVVTRSHEQSAELVEGLIALGAEPLICPAIAFAPPLDPGPLTSALRRLASYDWLVLTSANTVRFLFAALAELKIEPASIAHVTIAAIGPATAQALIQHGWKVSFVPSRHTAVDLLAEIGPIHGQRILIPTADIAGDTIATGLEARGAIADTVTAYRTIPGQGGQLLANYLQSTIIDATIFTSPSTIHYLLGGLATAGVSVDQARQQLGAIVCIGPVTRSAAHSAGFVGAAEPAQATVVGLIEALIDLFG